MEKILDDIRRDAITKLKLSKEKDQNLLIDAAFTIITISNIARNEGLVALEEAAEATESDFLKLIVTLIIDGTDPELVLDIAANEYWIREPEGIQAMITYLYLRGMSYIHIGMHTILLEKLLQSLIPPTWRQAYQNQLETIKEKYKEELLDKKEIVEAFTNIHPVFQDESTLEMVYILEKQIHTLTNLSIQRVIRDVINFDLNFDLSNCLCALSKDSQKKILDNLTIRLANIITKNAISYYSHPMISEKDVSESILRVLSVIKKLDDIGEIYIPTEFRI